MSDVYLPAGRIAGLFGVQGELKVDPSPAGAPLFVVGAMFRLADESSFALQVPNAPLQKTTLSQDKRLLSQEVTIAQIRPHKGRYLVIFAEYPNAAVAEKLIGRTLMAKRNRLLEALLEDEFLDADLIGMQLEDELGNRLGEVQAVEHFPASPMLAIGKERRLVPFIKAFITNIDTQTRTIYVQLPPGLLDDSALIA